MQFFRYSVGLWRWAQRAVARENLACESREEALHGHESSAEKPEMAGAAGIFSGRLLPAGIHRGVRREEPGELGREDAGPDSASYLGGQVVGRQAIASGDREIAEQRKDTRFWAEPESMGAMERSAGGAQRRGRCRSSDLQHFRSESGRRIVPGVPGERCRG